MARPVSRPVARLEPVLGPHSDVSFRPSPQRTLGVEWELGLVDPHTLDLTSRARELLLLIDASGAQATHARPTHTRSTVTKELLTNTVEIVTDRKSVV